MNLEAKKMLKTVFTKWDEVNEELKKGTESYVTNFYLSKDSATRVYLGLDNKLKIVYLEFSKDALSSFKCPSLKGMDICVCNADFIDPTKRYLAIKNIDPNDDVFYAFTSSLCDVLQECHTYLDTFEGLKTVINDYRSYFMNANFKLKMSEEQGLCAELLELKRLIELRGEKVVFNWQGPSKNKRDFTFDENDVAVEIKSTLSQTNTSITISNENQLDCNYPKTLKKLFLKVYIFETNDIGFDVVSCANDVLNCIKDVNIASTFLLSLLKAKVDLKVYKPGFKFTLQDKKLYLITEEFPKITKDTISNLIFNVKYKIKIDSVTGFEIPEESKYE